MTFGHSLRSLWPLEEGITFLNHGSFGATPKPVLEAQTSWRQRMEQQPIRFFTRELQPALREAAQRLGEHIGARGEDLVFVENATTAVNAVVNSLILHPGDELVITSHGYGAIRNTLRHHCQRSGARLLEIPLPYPPHPPSDPTDPGLVVQALQPVLGERTRLVILDHITSPTALILPVQVLIQHCRQRQIPVLIDGAHAPGQIPLHLESLQADWYTGNAHKWLYAPKGCAFLWTHPDRQADTYPTVISHGWAQGYLERFDWRGTRDPSAWLALPTALDLIQTWDPLQIRTYTQTLVRWGAEQLLPLLGLTEIPVAAPWSGAMISLPLDGLPLDNLPLNGPPGFSLEHRAGWLHDRLWDQYQIEVPIIPFQARLWIRMSAQIYSEQEDFLTLVRALDHLCQASDGDLAHQTPVETQAGG